MLKDNHNNHSTCAFAEQIVSYLYGESSAREKDVFETHLKSCAICADEFAGISAVQSSVLEWRNIEFSPLEMPPIEIPCAAAREFYKTETGLKVSRSRFEEIRRLFTFSPALTASASFAVVAVCVGMIFFAIKSADNIDVASIESKNTEQVTFSPKVDGENVSAAEPIDDLNRKNSETSSSGQPETFVAFVENTNRKSTADSSVARKDSVVGSAAVSRSSVKKPNRESNSYKIKSPNVEDKKPAFARTGKTPRLHNVEEIEDKSLRLAELLDEETGAK